jgi:hypothetical protein
MAKSKKVGKKGKRRDNIAKRLKVIAKNWEIIKGIKK